jgi:hypothetical protein
MLAPLADFACTAGGHGADLAQASVDADGKPV